MQPVSPWTAALRVAVLSSSLLLSGLYLHWKSGRPLPFFSTTKSAGESIRLRPSESEGEVHGKTLAEFAGLAPLVDTRMPGTKSDVLEFDLRRMRNDAPVVEAATHDSSAPRQLLLMGTKSYSGATIVVSPGELQVSSTGLGSATERALQLPGSSPSPQPIPHSNAPAVDPFGPPPAVQP